MGVKLDGIFAAQEEAGLYHPYCSHGRVESSEKQV